MPIWEMWTVGICCLNARFNGKIRFDLRLTPMLASASASSIFWTFEMWAWSRRSRTRFKAWLVYCLKDLMWDRKLSNVALTRHLFVSYTSNYKGTRVHLLVVLAPTLRLIAYSVCILVRTYCILVLILVIEPKTVSVVSYTNHLCIYSQHISSVSSSVWNPRN